MPVDFDEFRKSELVYTEEPEKLAIYTASAPYFAALA
jgi:hypothetical protein